MNQFFLDTKILYALWNVIRQRDFFLGPTVQNFEESLRLFTKSRYAVGVSSGTDALVLSLKALGIGYGDEVIVPAISFVGTANAISWVGATPVFVDIEETSRTINPALVEKAVTKNTKALLPVHLDGRIADMDSIMKIGRKYNIPVVVDGAHAVGSRYKNRSIGELGDIVCLSFSFTKPFGSYGNAGAILTNDAALHEKLLPFRMYGARSKKEIYSENIVAAGSHRLDSFQAAVLNCKLPLWNMWVEKQRKHYSIYQKLLSGISSINLPQNNSDFLDNAFRFTILSRTKNELREFLLRDGIHIVDYYQVPLPRLPAFKHLGHTHDNFPVAEKFARDSITLPTQFNLPESTVVSIAGRVRNFCQHP